MRSDSNKWMPLFLFCLGLVLASSFCMKWIEGDLIYNQQPISILGLELYYPAQQIVEIFSGMDENTKTILRYHLSFDFVFMAGCFPGIASICMIASGKSNHKILKSLLSWLAFFQFIAWLLDVMENYLLLKWLQKPVIGRDFEFFHIAVYSKWTIAILGILTTLFAFWMYLFRKGKQETSGPGI